MKKGNSQSIAQNHSRQSSVVLVSGSVNAPLNALEHIVHVMISNFLIAIADGIPVRGFEKWRSLAKDSRYTIAVSHAIAQGLPKSLFSEFTGMATGMLSELKRAESSFFDFIKVFDADFSALNYTLDCIFENIGDPPVLTRQLKNCAYLFDKLPQDHPVRSAMSFLSSAAEIYSGICEELKDIEKFMDQLLDFIVDTFQLIYSKIISQFDKIITEMVNKITNPAMVGQLIGQLIAKLLSEIIQQVIKSTFPVARVSNLFEGGSIDRHPFFIRIKGRIVNRQPINAPKKVVVKNEDVQALKAIAPKSLKLPDQYWALISKRINDMAGQNYPNKNAAVVALKGYIYEKMVPFHYSYMAMKTTLKKNVKEKSKKNSEKVFVLSDVTGVRAISNRELTDFLFLQEEYIKSTRKKDQYDLFLCEIRGIVESKSPSNTADLFPKTVSDVSKSTAAEKKKDGQFLTDIKRFKQVISGGYKITHSEITSEVDGDAITVNSQSMYIDSTQLNLDLKDCRFLALIPRGVSKYGRSLSAKTADGLTITIQIKHHLFSENEMNKLCEMFLKTVPATRKKYFGS